MVVATLIDPVSAGVVGGGTVIATLLQCGPRQCGEALGAVARLPRRRINLERVRTELLGHIQAIRQDGLVRARASHLGDAEIDEATAALIDHRSVAALLATHEHHRDRRVEIHTRACATLMHCAELAPVFGLAGTLLALARLAHAPVADNAFAGVIGAAVLTTLYGLLLAHLLLAPIARAVERAGRAEETARAEVIDWLAAQVDAAIAPPPADAAPARKPAHHHPRAA